MLRPGLRLVIARELRRIRRRPLYPALLLILPLATWLLLTVTFSQRVARELPIAVIDRDHSALSRRLTRALDASAGLLVLRRAAEESAERIMRNGEAYAVIELPLDLERSIRRAQPLPVALLYNAQLPLPAGLVQREVRTVVGTVSAELEVATRVARGEPAARALVAAEPIRTELHPLYNPGLDYAAFLCLALLPAVFHVFVLMAAIDAVGRELRERTAPVWLRSAAGSPWRAVAGKLVPQTLWFTVSGSVLFAITLRRFGIEPRGDLFMLLCGGLLLVLACQAVALLLVCCTASLRLALTAGAFLAGPAFVVAGVTFPLEAMPLAGRIWAAALPLTHYLAVQVGTIVSGAPARTLAAPLGALVAFTLAGSTLAALRLRGLLREPQFQGRL